MAITDTWTNPNSTTIDIGVGDVLTETVYDNIISNLYYLASSSGKIALGRTGSTGSWQTVYTNASGVSTMLALGKKDYVLISNSTASAPSFSSLLKDMDVHRVMSY